jgi:hypothetical protein
MERLAALTIILTLALIPVTFAASPLEARELTLRITQTGTIDIQEPVATASITLAIPQNTENQVIQRFSVKPDNVLSELVKDQYGNTMLKLKLSDLRAEEYNYAVETIVRSTQRLAPNFDISIDSRWLGGEIPDRIRELAWYYRGAATVSDAAGIVKFAHSMIDYDASSRPRTAEEVLQSGSGDSTANAIFLNALLRAAGIPTRTAIGDAWLPTENKISNHAWVEVLANENGNNIWIPFDSTFLRGGSINPDYIVKWTGNGLPYERIEFIGGGNVEWKPNSDRVDVLDSKTAPTLEITAVEPQVTFPRNLYGWLGAIIEPQGCGFWHLEPVSCINESRQSLLTFRDSERTIWACDLATVFWVFGIAGSNYICPVRIDEQSGAQTNVNVTINNGTPSRTLSIEGLESVVAGEEFNLISVGIDPDRVNDMVFYSPTLNEIIFSRAWPLMLKPGIYDFYLWFDGSLAKKTVKVLEQKEFSIALSSPNTAAIDEPTPVRIDVTNLLSTKADATIKLRVNNILANICWQESGTTSCSNEYALTLEAGETKSLEFTTTLATSDADILTASVEDMSASFISKQVEVVMPPLMQLEHIIRAFSTVLAQFSSSLSVLQRMTLGV